MKGDKKLKKNIVLLAVLLAAMLFTACSSEPQEVVNVYNWGEYIDESIFDDFEEQTGIKVNYNVYESNEQLYTVLNGGGVSYDVIIPSDYMISRMIEEDMLEKINFDNVPNIAKIDPAYLNLEFDPAQEYSVPYSWGVVGIIYNTKVVNEPVDSWSIIFDEKYSGQILQFDNSRDAMATALFYLGYPVNTTDKAQLEEAYQLLVSQKPILQGYVMDQIFDRMERGEAWAAPYYAGDYLTMVEENPDLGFSHPKEGFNIFIDAMCIPKGCQNKEGAEAFINFLCRPEISAANLDYIGYSTPETAAKDYLDEDVTSSPVSYPDDETLARSESFAELGVGATQTMNDLWLSVKTSTSNTTLYLVLTITAIAAVILFFLISGIIKRRKKARRCRKWRQT